MMLLSRNLRALSHPALWALGLFVLVSCILEGDKTAKRGSEVENEVYGVLVALDGKPVPGAKVKAVPSPVVAKSAMPRAPADSDSVVTDRAGRYSFQRLSAGRYNLFGKDASGSQVVLIPDVDHTDTTTPDDQGVDTLRAPGRIRGRILLGSRGKEGILAYLPGTSFLTVSDDSGGFVLNGIPQGTYTVRYSALGFLIVPDSGVKVRSGETVTLQDKRIQFDPDDDPPAPEGLVAVYDTVHGKVTLAWDSVPAPDILGYLIYRDSAKSLRLEPTLLEDHLIGGTSHIDWVGADRSEPVEVIYRVRAQDGQANNGPFSKPLKLLLMPGSMLTTSARVYSNEKHGFGQASLGDSVPLFLEYSNPGRAIREVRWVLGEGADTTWARTTFPATRFGMDTLVWIPNRLGRTSLSVVLIDETGLAWTAAGLGGFSMPLDVVRDPPIAVVGSDTTVSIGDAVRLHGSGSDRFGRIAAWEWDVGGTGAFRPSGRDTVIAVPGSAMKGWPCILKVVDDDGNAGLDTLLIDVLLDPPTVRAEGDTTVSIGDRVSLRGSGTDRFGSIQAWEWDIGGTGTFKRSGKDTSILVPAAADAGYKCLLKAIDDDGQVGLDTVTIAILADRPVADAGPDTLVSVNDSIWLSARAVDGFGTIVRWEWDMGGTGVFKEYPTGRVSAKSPSDSMASWPWVLRVTDDDGNQAFDTVRVKVVLDIPVGDAGRDTLVSIGDAVNLRATAKDGFGRIVRWEWDIGGTGNFRASRPDTQVTVPLLATEAYRCILRVTDDDGMASLDTLLVRVVLDPPIAGILSDRLKDAFFLDSIRLSGSPSRDGFGTIARWQWDIGGKGTFSAGSKRDTTIILPAVASVRYMAILKVTDDDGNTALDSIVFTVNPTGGIAWFKAEAAQAFTPRMQAAAAVFKGRMWIAGGEDGTVGGSDKLLNDVWSSADGGTWTLATANAPFAPRRWHRMAAFKDRLWVFGGRGSAGSLNDIWSSEDGVTWREESAGAAFSPRSGYTLLESAGKLWLIAGGNDVGGFNWKNDVWSTPDGKSWSKEADTTAFSRRHTPAGFVLGAKLWIGGGIGADGSSTIVPRYDLWQSTEGKSWTKVGGEFPEMFDYSTSQIVLGNRVWILNGGIRASARPAILWESANGADWNRINLNAPFEAWHASVVFMGRVWTLGGGEPGGPRYNEVWYSR